MGMAITWGYTSGTVGFWSDLSVFLRFLPPPPPLLFPTLGPSPGDSGFPAAEPRPSEALAAGMGSGIFDLASGVSASDRSSSSRFFFGSRLLGSGGSSPFRPWSSRARVEEEEKGRACAWSGWRFGECRATRLRVNVKAAKVRGILEADVDRERDFWGLRRRCLLRRACPTSMPSRRWGVAHQAG
jgi:hypothetical protein